MYYREKREEQAGRNREREKTTEIKYSNSKSFWMKGLREFLALLLQLFINLKSFQNKKKIMCKNEVGPGICT
jgi:hypothetical protein